MDPNDQLDVVYESLVHWADVILVSTPIRWGAASSLYYKMVERMNCIQNQVTIRNRVLMKNKVASFIITGGQDNVQARGGTDARLLRGDRLRLPQFPYIAHSRGWSAEDMERNIAYVRGSEELHDAARALVTRAVDTARFIVTHSEEETMVGQREPLVRAGRKASMPVRKPEAGEQPDVYVEGEPMMKVAARRRAGGGLKWIRDCNCIGRPRPRRAWGGRCCRSRPTTRTRIFPGANERHAMMQCDGKAGIRICDLTLLFGDEEYPLAGRTLDDAFRFFEQRVGRMLERPGEATPPHHAVATGCLFEPAACDLEQLAALYEKADIELRRINTPVRIWPHHFDMATLISLRGDRTIGVGFVPGDALFPEPYWYVTPVAVSPPIGRISRPCRQASGTPNHGSAPCCSRRPAPTSPEFFDAAINALR